LEQVRRSLRLDHLGFGNQGVGLLEAGFEDRWQRIEIGAADMQGAEQIDNALGSGHLPAEQLLPELARRLRRPGGRRKTKDQNDRKCLQKYAIFHGGGVPGRAFLPAGNSAQSPLRSSYARRSPNRRLAPIGWPTRSARR